jgi:hypothetical protein
MLNSQNVILVRIFCVKHGVRTWHILIKDTEFECMECRIAALQAVVRTLSIPPGQ